VHARIAAQPRSFFLEPGHQADLVVRRPLRKAFAETTVLLSHRPDKVRVIKNRAYLHAITHNPGIAGVGIPTLWCQIRQALGVETVKCFLKTLPLMLNDFPSEAGLEYAARHHAQ